MAPRTTSRRPAKLTLAALLSASAAFALAGAALAVGLGALAPPARAQSGNGLYEPFPEAAVKQRAQRYVERLSDRTPGTGRHYSDARLGEGVFVRPGPGGRALSAPARGAASGRAGDRNPSGLAPAVQLLLLLAALALPAAALLGRARTRAT